MKLEKYIHPRIEETIVSFLQPFEISFFHFFLARVTFYKATEGLPTMCATVINMRLAICWNEDFLNELNDNELRFLILHEAFHLIHHHLERGRHYHPEKANIAMDMIINELIMKHYHKSRSGYVMSSMPILTREKINEIIEKIKSTRDLSKEDEKKIRDLEGKASGCVLDPNYKGVLAFEPLYEWLEENHEKSKAGGSHELSPDTKTMLDNAEIRDMMGDVHVKLDELGEDIKKQLVAEGVAKARLDVCKTRGSVPGDIEEVLSLLLTPPRQNNLKLLKRSISALKGKTKEKTWKRMNRRINGLKGKFGVANRINAGLDVSGSMWGTFDIVLRELFIDNYEINLVQIDTQVQKVEVITRKNQLKNFKMKGGGGTCLQPFVDHVLNPVNGLNRYSTVILTDGYCDSLDFKGSLQDFLILTTGDLVNYSNGPRVKQIKLEGVK
jgi:predicted metal-dependent peptidase